MQTYTVHEPPNAGADRIDRASELRFVKDGFAWTTAIFPPLGFAMSQLWIPLVAYLVLVGAAASALSKLGVSEGAISIFVMALQIFLGFEHSTLQRYMLERDGWTMLGTVSGKSLAECERRFFEQWLPSQPMIATAGAAPATSVRPGSWLAPWKNAGHKA
ncbi:MAG: DUF2628 domain-containing protein [Hyphomicrobium sp.]|nr:DUF2628 domain-containing protein [Hyphomicrobium sp.]